MDATANAKLLAALDAELLRRQSSKDAAQDAAWEKELAGDEIVLMARRLARDWDRFLAKPPPAVPMSLDDLECAVEDALDYAKRLFSLASAVDRAERHKAYEEAIASGAPRRRPTIVTPRVRVAAPSSKAKPVIDVLANSDGPSSAPCKSRTEIWKEQQAADAAARQALRPRPEQRAPRETAMGWHRGLVACFDQRTAIGTIKFSGAAGFTEAPLAPGAFRGSGLTVLIPNQSVDCQIKRRVDGSVFIDNIRLAAGSDPQSSEAEQAAAEEARRFQIQLDRKWMH